LLKKQIPLTPFAKGGNRAFSFAKGRTYFTIFSIILSYFF